MVRALILAAFICVYCGLLESTEARWTIRPSRPTTTTTARTTWGTTPKSTTLRPTRPKPRPTTTTTTPSPIIVDLIVDDEESDDDKYYHPAEVKNPRLIEQFDSRSVDGHYEYRYVLSNGDTRYERAYWLPVGNTKVLARKGYFSYPMPNHEFRTVYYTADHQGFHQDSSTFTKRQPVLPRSLDVPEHEPPKVNEQQEKPYNHHKPSHHNHHKPSHHHPHKPSHGHGYRPKIEGSLEEEIQGDANDGTEVEPVTTVISEVVEVDEQQQEKKYNPHKPSHHYPHKPSHGHGYKTKIEGSIEVGESMQDAELQQNLRKRDVNDVTEFEPVTTVISEIVEADEQQQEKKYNPHKPSHHYPYKPSYHHQHKPSHGHGYKTNIEGAVEKGENMQDTEVQQSQGKGDVKDVTEFEPVTTDISVVAEANKQQQKQETVGEIL